MTLIRRLTESGLSTFRSWINEGGKGQVPFYLLEDSSHSERVNFNRVIEFKAFSNRMEFGQYLCSLMDGVDLTEFSFDSGIWDWLSLFYFEQLCPSSGEGGRKINEKVRYLLEFENRKWSRHLVRMSWLSVWSHGENAKFMLASPLNVHSDVLEQMAGQQELFASKSVVETACFLYWDDDHHKPKRGVGGRRGGSVRRLRKVMRQLRLTYDPDSMDVNQILQILPSEFSRWSSTDKSMTSTFGDRFLSSTQLGSAFNWSDRQTK